MITKPDQRIGDRDAEADDGRAGDDAERDEPVDAGVIPVGDERGTVEPAPGPQPHARRELVADEADQAGRGQHPQMGEVLRVQEPLDRLVQGDAGGDEDRRDDGEPGELLAARAAQEERDAERDRGERVAEVVDQVREQRDRAGGGEDDRLHERGDAEHAEADRDGLDALTRADDRAIDEPVRVAVAGVRLVAVRVLVGVGVAAVRDASPGHAPFVATCSERAAAASASRV